ncbi:MAG: membrane protein insertase YidC [Candidatus Firestonebacteria bacterium]
MGKNEKNFIIAIVLCLLVMFAFQAYISKTQPPAQPSQPAATVTAGAPDKSAAVSTETKAAPAKKPENSSVKTEGKDLSVETDDLTVVFNTKGAVIKSWALKGYPDNEKGKLIDLVWQEKDRIKPMALRAEELSLDENIIYSVKLEGLKLEFSAKTKSGGEVVKTFTLYKKGFKMDCSFYLKGGKGSPEIKNASIAGGAGIGNHKAPEPALTNISYINKKLIKDKPKVYGEETPLYKEIKQLNWTGNRDKFFASILIVDPAAGCSGTISKMQYGYKDKDGNSSLMDMPAVSFTLPAFKGEEGKKIDFSYYSGPLLYENLEAMKNDLFKALDYGFFGWLGIFFLKMLKFFYGIVGNWGLAVILLSLAIKAVLWWPNQVSYRSMKKMQEVQPHVNALREKYKSDPAKMNAEMFKIYKEKKVNPVTGCLPVLLTMPVLFALYAILVNAIELKNSPFYFWITDLSGPDPIWVLPILMGATMWVQQKMTPSTDPQQAKIFLWMMPIMFTGMSIWFAWPSGLVLFWFVQNVVSIIQQYMTNKAVEPAV